MVPFTPSHVAAVLPLRSRGRSGLPLAALAAGSMSPDLPYFLPVVGVPQWTPDTHTALGVVTTDLLLGISAWIVWRLLSPALRELSPRDIRARWSMPRPTQRWWVAVPIAVLVGATTHVVWDEFTHAGRFGDAHFSGLAASYASPIGLLPGYWYAQYLSGLVGLGVVVWVGWRQPRLRVEPSRVPIAARAAPWVVLVGGILGGVTRLSGVDSASARLLTFATITGTMGGGSLALILLASVSSLSLRRARIARRTP